MEYSKYHMYNYRIHVIKTNKFKTVTMRINFKRKIDEIEITLRRFLSYMLLNSSLKYKTERELNIEIENLYNLGLNSNVRRSGKYSILSFTMNILNEKYTEDGMLKKSLNFLNELLFNPNVEDNKFETQSFSLIKKALEEEIKSFKDDPNRYSKKRLYEETNEDSVFSYNYWGTLEQLENITEKNLYEYYKSVIDNDILDVFIIGDVDEIMIKDMISEIIPNRKRIKEQEKHYLDYLPIKEEKEVIEEGDYNQSKLQISLRLNKLTDFESEYVMQVFNFIFGGGSESKLFQEVREKNSLCYSIGASYLLLDRLVVISAGIDSQSYDKTIELVRQCLQDMKEGKFKKEDIEKAKIIYTNGCKEILDSPVSILNNYISKEYLDVDLLEEKIKKIKKVNKTMLIELSKKIELDTIFLLKGGVSSEKNTSN